MPSAREDCKIWLLDYLNNTAREAGVVYDTAKVRGFPIELLRSVSRELKIDKVREPRTRFNDARWWWSLPKSTLIKEVDMASKTKQTKQTKQTILAKAKPQTDTPPKNAIFAMRSMGDKAKERVSMKSRRKTRCYAAYQATPEEITSAKKIIANQKITLHSWLQCSESQADRLQLGKQVIREVITSLLTGLWQEEHGMPPYEAKSIPTRTLAAFVAQKIRGSTKESGNIRDALLAKGEPDKRIRKSLVDAAVEYGLLKKIDKKTIAIEHQEMKDVEPTNSHLLSRIAELGKQVVDLQDSLLSAIGRIEGRMEQSGLFYQTTYEKL